MIFEHSILFVALKDGKSQTIKKLKLTNNISKTRVHFSDIYEKYSKYDNLPYEYGYKNDLEELSYVEFDLPNNIYEAMLDASQVPDFSNNENDWSKVKYIFMGKTDSENTIVLFQKINKSQVLTRGKGIWLGYFTDSHTLDVYSENLISLTNKIDCFYSNHRLYFNNMYYARQIFDMKQYIAEASEEDVETFLTLPIFEKSTFNHNHLTQNTRRMIKCILECNLFQNCTVQEIQERVRSIPTFNLQVSESQVPKIIFPEEKKKFTTLLKILSNRVYHSLLTNEIKETNSSKDFRP